MIPYSQEFCLKFMRLALAEAESAARCGEVPVGCVVIRDGEVLSSAHNLRQTMKDPTAHAEILALRQAAGKLGTWHLEDCVLFVTLEPCPMCAGALVNARIGGLVYGTDDPKAGACRSLYSIPQDGRLNHVTPVLSGILAPECGKVLSEFFRSLRSNRDDECKPSQSGETLQDN